MRNNNLLIHASTKIEVDRFIKKPSHAVMITGQPGSGKQAIAAFIAIGLLGKETLDDYPYYYFVDKPKDKQDISIDAIRGIIDKLKLKTVIDSPNAIKRVILIDGGHYLSTEAQNALLKAIEEPPPDTAFILTAVSASSVLPTIASRVQKLPVMSVSLETALDYFSGNHNAKDITSSWTLSGGRVGLLSALLSQSSEHELKQAVDKAKDLLAMKRYHRVLFLDGISADKAEFLNVLDALSRILNALHHSSLNASNEKQSKKLLASRKLVITATSALNKNASARLIALDLAFKMPV
jgi:DNA polymerase-3 subunit delta'